MALSGIVTAIEAELVAISAWVVAIQIGDEFVEETGDVPRIVVVPSKDTFEAPSGPGGNPRPIRNRIASAEVVIWGDTRDNTEGLVDQFVIALHRAVKGTDTSAHKRGGSYTLGPGAWTRKTNLTRSGFEYRLSFTVPIPILDRQWAQTPNAPPSPSTYTGEQANTNPTVPNPSDPDDPLIAEADVAAELGNPPTAQGNVTITVPTP